jgi:hypothetical protein
MLGVSVTIGVVISNRAVRDARHRETANNFPQLSEK